MTLGGKTLKATYNADYTNNACLLPRPTGRKPKGKPKEEGDLERRRLVGKLCKHCRSLRKTPYELGARIVRYLGRFGTGKTKSFYFIDGGKKYGSLTPFLKGFVNHIKFVWSADDADDTSMVMVVYINSEIEPVSKNSDGMAAVEVATAEDDPEEVTSMVMVVYNDSEIESVSKNSDGMAAVEVETAEDDTEEEAAGETESEEAARVAKRDAAPEQDGWTCSHCTFKNCTKKKCSMCYRARWKKQKK